MDMDCNVLTPGSDLGAGHSVSLPSTVLCLDFLDIKRLVGSTFTILGVEPEQRQAQDPSNLIFCQNLQQTLDP